MSTDSPPAAADPAGVSTERFTDSTLTASWLLRLAIVIHAIGTLAVVYTTRQTQFGNYLFLYVFDYRFPVEDPYLTAVFVEKITVLIFFAAAVVIVFRPWWPLLAMIGAYAFAEAASGVFNAGYRFSEWTVPAHALRWGVPFVLLALVAFPNSMPYRQWRIRLAAGLLRLMLATVFLFHGLQALYADPHFIDLIIGSGRRLLDTRITESTAVFMLRIIGVVDIAVVIAVLVYPTPILVPRRFWANPCVVCPIRRVIVPIVFGWAAFWGFITAASRMTALGWLGLTQYPALLDRASHFLAPIALWLLFTATYRNAACAGQQPVAHKNADSPK